MRISCQPSSVQTTIDKKQLENEEYFSYLGSTITNSAGCTEALTSRIAIAKAAFNKK
jgi:hypothetical protein